MIKVEDKSRCCGCVIELELSECLESCKIEFPFWQRITTVIMMR